VFKLMPNQGRERRFRNAGVHSPDRDSVRLHVVGLARIEPTARKTAAVSSLT
jgi:hypothetical protein